MRTGSLNRGHWQQDPIFKHTRKLTAAGLDKGHTTPASQCFAANVGSWANP